MANPGFIITSLMLVAQVFETQPALWELLDKPGGRFEGEEQLREVAGRVVNEGGVRLVYDPWKREPRFAMPSGLWELDILKRHFNPKIRKLVIQLINKQLPLEIKGNPLKSDTNFSFLKRMKSIQNIQS
jgi:hypothetical protein